jgi:predicted RNA-binding protein YlqC (UPF0109 family)
LKDLIEYIARALVDRPEVVELKITPSPEGMLYELKVAPDDVGKIIGRDGRTVNAWRALVTAAATKKGEKARVEILDDRRNAPRAELPPAANAS